MKMLYLMQGIPASGKSTMAEMIAQATDGMVYSTDALWYDEFGVYQYDSAQIGAKHAQNMQLVAEAMVQGKPSIIVDNTNTKKSDMKPYVVMAKIHGYEIQVVRVECSLDLAKERNAKRPLDRKIPDSVIENMWRRLRDFNDASSYVELDIEEL